MVTLVRQSSDIPNITNRDDTKMIRYAYGGHNGVVKDFGNECDYQSESSSFKILSGRIVLDGWEVDIDGAGWFLIPSLSVGTQFYSVYLETNIATESAEIKSVYATGSYPVVDKGDDLTAILNGTARLLLYELKVENGIIVSVEKKFSPIQYSHERIEENRKKIEQSIFNPRFVMSPKEQLDKQNSEFHAFAVEESGELGYSKGIFISSGNDSGGAVYLALSPDHELVGNFRNHGIWAEDDGVKVRYAMYASEDTSKGTIENRLTALGFKEAAVSGASNGSKVTRQGNYVIGTIQVNKAYTFSLAGSSGTRIDVSTGIHIYSTSTDPYNAFYPKTVNSDASGAALGRFHVSTVQTNGDSSIIANHDLWAWISSTGEIVLSVMLNTSVQNFFLSIYIETITVGYEAVAL